MNITIREIIPSDYQVVVELWNIEIGNNNVNEINFTETMGKMIKDDNYKTFVALHESKVVGFIFAIEALAFGAAVGVLWICGVAVQKDYQRQGVGSKLFEYMDSYAFDKGLSHIIVNSGFKRKDAHKVFEHKGYEKHSYCFSKNPCNHNCK